MGNSRRSFLKLMGGLPLALSFGQGQQAPMRPNILWLIAEDLGPQLRCYGDNQAFTPNLDRLARDGVRFTRFYSGMVCSPSRSSFMTGMYATSIGAHNHRSHRTDGYRLPEGVRVLSDWMRDAGYFTANTPKTKFFTGFVRGREINGPALGRAAGAELLRAGGGGQGIVHPADRICH